MQLNLEHCLQSIRAANSRLESPDSSKAWDRLLTTVSLVSAALGMRSLFCDRTTPELEGLISSLQIWHPHLLLAPSYRSINDLP